MKFEMRKTSIRIIPETELDEVYLENVLELREKGDRAVVERVAPYVLDSSWAYAEIKKG